MEMSFDHVSTKNYLGLDLIRCTISSPKRKTCYMDVLGADGTIDLLKNEENPTYENRTVNAIFVIVDMRAQDTIDRWLNEFEGRTVPITLPGDPSHYVEGAVHLLYGSCFPGKEVSITATCMPWRLSVQECRVDIPAATEEVLYQLYNSGTRVAVPELKVAGGNVTVRCGNLSKVFTSGNHLLPDFAIPQKGSIQLLISGAAATIKYREAIL